MQRFIRLSLLMVLIGMFSAGTMFAKPQAKVVGPVASDEVRIFLKDSTYIIDRDYVISGTLIVEPGTEVLFYANGRVIVEAGGRFIADGQAHATYEPGSLNPLGASNSYYGYADPSYFLNAGVIDIKTVEELTVNRQKENVMYNVLYDTLNKTMRNLPNSGTYPLYSRLDAATGKVTSNRNEIIISYEQAMLLKASRISTYAPPAGNSIININPWTRILGADVDVTPETIMFRGQPVLNSSREWGHIVVLPGARAAFFRSCQFDNFRKDNTVDRADFYTAADFANYAEVNAKLKKMTNGGGGAITTLSARTWLLECKFTNNMARLRGGALQILEAPMGYPKGKNITAYYDILKNPQVVNPDMSYSDIIYDKTRNSSKLLKIDCVDETTGEPLSDFDRQYYDDARLALYLGRVRNVDFDNNHTLISNTKFDQNGLVDDTSEVADEFNARGLRHLSAGGAIFIASRREVGFGIAGGNDGKYIEFALGSNDVIKMNGANVNLYSGDNRNFQRDRFVAKNNYSENYAANGEGSMGGAIYLSYGTSMILSGQLDKNSVKSPYEFGGDKARGGAIFVENCPGARLQFRGNPAKSEGSNPNPTHITNNKARLGGAVYVDGYSEKIPASPIIGGSDALIATRDWGFDVVFEGNTATQHGGAIYTSRQMTINGAGGVEGNSLIGYGGLYPVKFYNNKANFSGGAIKSSIPPYDINGNHLSVSKKITTINRAEFIGNEVGVPAKIEGDYNYDVEMVAGGGAFYGVYTELTEIKGTLFENNKVLNGNGAAVSLVQIDNTLKHAWVSDLDVIIHNADGSVKDYISTNDVFTHDNSQYPADVRMLTRFIGNEANVDAEALATQSGSGATQMTVGMQQPTQDLFASFTQGTTHFVAGANGTLIKITNGGADWKVIETGVTNTIEDIYFPTATRGFFVGANGLMGRTEDGGTTWTTSIIDNQIGSIKDMDFNGTQNAYAITELGYFLKSTDGGTTWTKTLITAIGARGLSSISAVSKDVVVAAGENGVILKTTNGGTTWNAVNLIGKSNHYTAVDFVSSTKGFIVGNGGLLIKTTDAGDSWQEVFEKGESLNALAFSNEQTGYAFGMVNTCYKTTDGGTTWNDMPTIKDDAHWFAAFFGGKDGLVVGSTGTIMKTNDYGTTWAEVNPKQPDNVTIDVVRYNPDQVALPENGIGLGGAVYVLDDINWKDDQSGNSLVPEEMMFLLNRVRMINNKAYTGSAIYSDNFDVKFVLSRSLITKNVATSEIGLTQNVINGPMTSTTNPASSDLAAATIYAEVQGPLPATIYSEAANSIYDNEARFLIRIPDAPNTKGLLAGGTPGIGFGGTNVIRGNYWGETQAEVTMEVSAWNRNDITTKMETFFVAGDPTTSWLPFLYHPESKLAKSLGRTPAQYATMFNGDYKTQGPFESIGTYMYLPIPLQNADKDITAPNANSIPEKVLFSGKVYDIYDKGTDIKTIDYANRRMSPIEDFAVGIPPKLHNYDKAFGPYEGNYVIKWTRDPAVAEATDAGGKLMYPAISALQRIYWAPDVNGIDHHPIGYPLYLQANIDYSGDENRTNHNDMFLNESVFFVINETNNDFIRVNMKQVAEEAPYREVFRNTVELVPDLSLRKGDSDRNRYINRRLDEGLKTLGNGADMLRALTTNPYNEDLATLQGRKYHADYKNLGLNENLPLMMVNNLFSNRPTMPTTNQDGTSSMTTYFAGERYRALPVKVGDTIRVVSRTELWRIEDESQIDAVMKGGLKFVVSESTSLPEFTGDIVKLDNQVETIIVPSDKPWKDLDTIVVDEFKNTIFVTEDRTYPAPNETYNNDRDTILTVTAIDTLDMYDPRSVWTPKDNAELLYKWSVAPGSGLSYWLSTVSYNADKMKNGANGYIEFQGHPINPFVVPGGEKVTVSASNYPPTYRLVDKLKADGISADLISKFIEIYPPYFNATIYDVDPLVSTDNARYLQQDTIDIGSKYEQKHEFDIFVIDSVPVFLPWDEAQEVVNRMDKPSEVYVTYNPTEYSCSYEDVETYEQFLLANVTDKLRFQMDINTNDECEDHSPAAAGWDYKYGMTSYGFMNIAVNNKNQDSATYDGIIQTRPAWMSDQYMYKHGNDVTKDAVLADFTTFGKLNVRIDKAEAMTLLNPFKTATENGTGYLTSDTVFTVIANDGHSGVASKQYHVTINYQPEIITATLPEATQDQEYNYVLGNGVKIEVKDANFNQPHKYRLLYPATAYGNEVDLTDPGKTWAKDPCFTEAGEWNLATMSNTPTWLRINSETGVLYGTPGLTDFPDASKESITTRVSVLVTDIVGGQEMLSAVKTFDLVVNRATYAPHLMLSMATICVDKGGDFEQEIRISDLDLLRSGEVLQIAVLDMTGNPISGLTVKPSVIDGNNVNTDEVTVKLSATNFQATATDENGKIAAQIVVQDKFGHQAVSHFMIGASDEVDFVANVMVENSNSGFQVLQFGTSPVYDCSIGDGTNGEDVDPEIGTGKLDYNLCEYELPPLPPLDVFDARWRIPLRNGILRNIQPATQSDPIAHKIRSIYEATFQAGGLQGSNSTQYPVTIKWNPKDVPDAIDAQTNPYGGTWTIKDPYSNGQIFRCSMSRPQDAHYQFYASNITMGPDKNNSDLWVITISRSDIDGFIIDYEFDGVPVNEDGINATGIISVSPNPMTTTSSVKFAVQDPTNLTIDVLDNLGRVVTTLETSKFYTNGIYNVEWNGRDYNNNEMASGQYMIRLNANGNVSTYPVVIVK